MDDILTDIKTKEIKNKLAEINNLHTLLKFTMTREEKGSIPFLDMKIIHNKWDLHQHGTTN